MYHYLQDDIEDAYIEPPGYRYMTKKQLYNSLADLYLQPEIDSKGVNKRWLIGIAEEEYFRVELQQYRQFELSLQNRHSRKAAFINLSVIYNKFAALLRERNEREVGMQPGVIPQLSFLEKVVRFFDQENLLEMYQFPCPQPAVIPCQTRQIMVAKQAAQRVLFGDRVELRSPKVISMLKDITEAGRRI